MLGGYCARPWKRSHPRDLLIQRAKRKLVPSLVSPFRIAHRLVDVYVSRYRTGI